AAGQGAVAKWRKPTAGGDPDTGGPSDGGDGGSGGSGPRRPGGPPDRYRDEEGQVVDRNSGEVLHDQNPHPTLPSPPAPTPPLPPRPHTWRVRVGGHGLAQGRGRAAAGATAALPANTPRARAGGPRYAPDARQQVRVWGNTVREDRRAWAETGRQVSRDLRENS